VIHMSREQTTKQYDAKKGIAFGAFAGFIGGIAFAGVIMGLSPLLHLPTGVFLDALGLLVIPNAVQDAVLIGTTAFAIILIQGIVVGIIFGIVTSKSSRLHLSSKRKGVALGLATGIIAFIVIYIPMIYSVFPTLLSQAVASYPESQLSMFGLSNYTLTVNRNAYQEATLGLGIISYLVYGFIMGGIATLEYSVYHFVINQRKEENATKGAIGKSQ
jgi:hypothetical protein